MDPETLSMMWTDEVLNLVFGAGTAGEYAYIAVYAGPSVSPITERPMISAMMMGLREDTSIETLGRYHVPMTEEGCDNLIKQSIESLRK